MPSSCTKATLEWLQTLLLLALLPDTDNCTPLATAIPSFVHMTNESSVAQVTQLTHMANATQSANVAHVVPPTQVAHVAQPTHVAPTSNVAHVHHPPPVANMTPTNHVPHVARPTHVTQHVTQAEAMTQSTVNMDRDVHDALERCGIFLKPYGIIGGNASVVKQMCRDGIFNDSIACAENVLNSTSEDEPRYWYPDTIRLKIAYDTLCHNLELYTDHSDCLPKLESEISSCSEAVVATVEEWHHNYTQYAGDHFRQLTVWEAICAGHWKMHDCCVTPVREKCGQQMGQLVSIVVQGSLSPVCVAYKQVYGQWWASQSRAAAPNTGHSLVSGQWPVLVALLCCVFSMTCTFSRLFCYNNQYMYYHDVIKPVVF